MNLAAKLSSIKDHALEYIVTGFFGAIPTPIGMVLRNIAYYPMLRASRLPAFIQSNVQLIGVKHIQFGRGVHIQQGTTVDSRGNKIRLGDYVYIDRSVEIRMFSGYEGSLEIGENSYIAPFVFIGGPGKIQIDHDCKIASHSTLIANNHVFDDVDIPIRSQGLTCKGIHIEEGCWLGSGVRVLDGVNIGRGSVIGAGAVVAKDIPAYSVAAGVPAKVIRKRTLKHQTKVELNLV